MYKSGSNFFVSNASLVVTPGVMQQSIGFGLDHQVALAAEPFEARSIQNRDLASAVLDDALTLQFASRFRDAFAAHAQHVGDQLLGHVQVVAMQAIQRQ